MALLTVADINIWSDSRAQQSILKNINFSVEKGEMVGILGLNGAGKTSLLWSIAGFIKQKTINPDFFLWGNDNRVMTGSVTISGKNVTVSPPGDRDLSIVPQNLLLYPTMSAYDNIAFSLLNKGLKDDEIKARINHVAEAFHLLPLLAKKPDKLSGGQQQRVAIARALVRRPKIILFDEPLASMDIVSKNEVIPFIKDYLRSYGGASLYVTHDPYEAASFCDKIALLFDSGILQFQTPMEIYKKPKNFLVGRFFAELKTFIEVSYKSNENHLQIDLGGSNSLVIPIPNDMSTVPLQNIKYVGFRGEQLVVKNLLNSSLIAQITDVYPEKGYLFARIRFQNNIVGVAKFSENSPSASIGQEIGLEISINRFNELTFFDVRQEIITIE